MKGQGPLKEIRLPAEWEQQDGILLAWPHSNTDWLNNLEQVTAFYIELIRQITRFEKVLLITPAPDNVLPQLSSASIDLSKIVICKIATNDTWTRDYGPVTIEANKQLLLLDFSFNGWGLKFAADLDNQVNRNLKQQGVFLPDLKTVNLVLEGGSIENDGAGTIMTTSQCLLSPKRNPQLDRNKISNQLQSLFGAKRLLWLDHGHLEGDDTDSHIDTLARFCPDNTIIYVACNDPADCHYESLKKMKRELMDFTTAEGLPYRLLELPWPAAVTDNNGSRLPASYANYLIINNAVLVPSYCDPADETALAVISLAFPNREIIGINCLPLIEQHGSLHCVTMQLPKGVMQ